MSLWQVLRSMDSVAVYRARIKRSKEAGGNRVRCFLGPVHLAHTGAVTALLSQKIDWV